MHFPNLPLCQVLFTVASCLYLPYISGKRLLGTTVANLGTWVFRVGTCSYLTGSGISLVSIARTPGGLGSDKRVTIGVLSYIVGAVLYFIGGLLSQLGLPGFAATWVAGSCFFVLGAALFVVPHSCASKANMIEN